jgi:hypothetical protein
MATVARQLDACSDTFSGARLAAAHCLVLRAYVALTAHLQYIGTMLFFFFASLLKLLLLLLCRTLSQTDAGRTNSHYAVLRSVLQR